MLSKLNQQQRDSIMGSINSNALVLAGAGSGKTRVLITRIEYIIKELGIHPSCIMAITFTKKAANELKERLNNSVDDDELAHLWVGTYHSICLKILDIFGENIGIKEGYTILDTYNSRKCAADVMLKMGLEANKKTVGSYLKRVSTLKNNLVFPKTYREKVLKKFAGDVDSASTDSDYIFADFYSKYQAQNIKNNVMDFDDMILYTILLLSTNKEAQDFVRNKFRYILADEVQDSNPSNMVLLNLLSKYCNLFMVGDEDQSIYGFRGARPDLVVNYVNKQESTKIFKLEQNYRSTQIIVNASNSVIAHNDERMDKTCFSKNAIGEKIQFNVSGTNLEEAAYVAKRIKQHVAKGGKYGDIMILYRTNSQSRSFEEVFLNYNVPYSLVGSLSFNERAEIKDCMAVLKLACNLRDKYSFRRVLNTLEGVGKKTIDDLMNLMDLQGDAVEVLKNCSVKSSKARSSLSFLLGILSIIDKKPTAVLNKIADYYIAKLENSGEEKAVDRVDNIKELQKVVIEKESEGLALQEFVMQMDLMSANDKETGDNAVTMMTIHASKGLESKVVFLVGVNDGMLPHENCYQNANGELEERRLMYVGMTRAEELLYISRYNEDSRRTYEESVFLREIPINYVEYDDIMF